MPATKRGIFHNLRESNYTISNSEIVLFFSSKLYRKMFLERYKKNRLFYLSKMSKNDVEEKHFLERIADINLYVSIELRGFYAWFKGETVSCEELYLYALQEPTAPNTLDWHAIQKPKLDERRRSME